MKIIDVLQARKVLEAHANDSVSPRFAYKIMKFLKTTEQEEMFFSKELSILAEKYSEKNEDGTAVTTKEGGIHIQPSLVEECNQKIAELQNTEVDVMPHWFMLSDFNEIKTTAAEMMALDAFLARDTD